MAWRRIKARNAKRILHLQAAADSGDSGDGEGLEGNRVRGGAEPSSPSAEPSAFGDLGVAAVDVALRFAVESAVPSDWQRGGLGPFGPFAAPFGVQIALFDGASLRGARRNLPRVAKPDRKSVV